MITEIEWRMQTGLRAYSITMETRFDTRADEDYAGNTKLMK